MKLIKKRRVEACILLSLLTVGIFAICWMYRLVKTVKALKNDTGSCVGELLCILFVPYYAFYWWYTRGNDVKRLLGERNYHNYPSGTLYMVLSIFGLSIVAMAIMQNDFNTVPFDIVQSRELESQRLHRQRRTREAAFQTLITGWSSLYVLLAFIPIFLMLFLSLKNQSQFYANLWAIPNPPQWRNYDAAWSKMIGNMINSVVTVSVGTLLIVSLSAMSGYVFARLEFPGKKFLFMMMLALMMIPGVLTLTPSFKLIQRLGLKNTWWALWLPWASGGQVMGMYLCRTFITNQPASLFESARIDGANELKAFFYIAIPLAKPILATLVVMNMISLYGDFIWPLLVIESNTKQVISVAIQTYSSSTGMTDYGAMIAGFVMATVPLVIMFTFSSRLYIEGITSGAVKA